MRGGADDANQGNGPGECAGHVFVIEQLQVDGLRLRRALACRCGAIAYQGAPGDYALGSGDTTWESRQPLFDRRWDQDDIG